MWLFKIVVIVATAAYVTGAPDWKGTVNECVYYNVRQGDYCYKIAQINGITYEQFLRQKPSVDCTNLYVGQTVCLFPSLSDPV